MNKGFWFIAGSAAGAYAVTRARRTAEVFTYDGLHDRLSGLFVGARLFAGEVRAGAAEKESELRERLELAPTADHELPAAGPEPLRLVVSPDAPHPQLDRRRGSND